MSSGSFVGKMRDNLERGGTILLQILASGTSHVLMILILLLMMLWLLYSRVWQPLNQDTPLPDGVLADNPALQVEVYNKLEEARDIRIQLGDSGWERYSSAFISEDFSFRRR